MRLLTLARRGQAPNLVSQTFTSSQTWVAPAGVSMLATVGGGGAAGAADYYTGGDTTPGAKTVMYDQFLIAKPGGTDYHSHSEGTWSGSTQPENTYTRSYIGDTSNVYDYNDVYTSYVQAPDTTTPLVYHAATTGASTTGFGQTFVGGTGGAATTSTVSNVAVTPGASYTLSIPSGGSITITYFQ